MAAYGRRRAGKTFLVRQFFAKELCFELMGIYNAAGFLSAFPGGLHNRVTRRIRLEPFSLGEVAECLQHRRVFLDRYQTIEPAP